MSALKDLVLALILLPILLVVALLLGLLYLQSRMYRELYGFHWRD